MRILRNMMNMADSPWRLAGWALLFLFPVTALVVDKAASTIFTIFALAGLYLLTRGRHEKPDATVRWVLIAFAAYFFVGLLSFLLGEQTRLGEKLLGRDIRFLAAVPAFYVVARLSDPRFHRWLPIAIACGGVLTGVVASWEAVAASMLEFRAAGASISIVFGHLAAALCLANIAFLMFGLRKYGAWSMLGALGALIAVLFSVTRGALLSMVLMACVMVILWTGFSSSRWRVVGLTVLLLVLVLAVPGIGDRVSARVNSAFFEAVQIVEQSEKLRGISFPDAPSCYANAEFLNWVIENSLLAGHTPLHMEIRESAAEHLDVVGAACRPQNLLSIRNESANKTGWVYLPFRSVPPDAAISGSLVAMGQGELGLGGVPAEFFVEIDSDRLKTVEFAQHPASDSRFVIILRPGQQLQIVPVIRFPGEYAYSGSNTSVGMRMDLWHAAWAGFVDAPLLGQGAGAFPVYLEKQARAGASPWWLVKLDHAHNEILTVAADRGLLGLLGLFAVYAAPFVLFWRRRDAFGVAGMAFVGSIFLSGLTETIFNHSLGITYYSLFVLILAAVPQAPQASDT